MPRIFAALDDSGRPLLARVYGGVPPPSFPTVALLSSLFSYGESIGVALREISTPDVRIVFKRIGETLLVLVSNEQASTEAHDLHLLQLVYNGVILISGQELLEGPGGGLPMPDKPQRDVDAIKKLFRGATTLIDYLLSEEDRPLGIRLQMPEVAYVSPENRRLLEQSLARLSEDCSSSLESIALAILWKLGPGEGADFLQGAVVAGTQQFLKQDSQDMVLLQALMRSLPPATLRDVPIYLPNSNPHVPIRLMTADLVDGLELVFLTGPSPGLGALPGLVNRHLKHAYGVLKDVADSISMPSSSPLPGMDVLEAMVVIQHSPPRCMEVTSAAAARHSDSSPFDARGRGRKQRNHCGVLDCLISFTLCMSPMISFGQGKDAEEARPSLPKYSNAETVQMMTPSHRLISTSSVGGLLRIYAAAPQVVTGARAMDAASAALQAVWLVHCPQH